MIRLICELSRELFQRVALNESLTFLMATSHCETEALVLNEWHRNIYYIFFSCKMFTLSEDTSLLWILANKYFEAI